MARGPTMCAESPSRAVSSSKTDGRLAPSQGVKGRLFHPREYPQPHTVPAPRTKTQPATSNDEIRAIYRLVAELPPHLGMQLQTLVDLCYGAGARAPDFKILRGTAIRSLNASGRMVCVVTLPNASGGTRQVPITNPDINSRLLAVAARVGDHFLLAPNSKSAERNVANRVSERLRSRGYPGVNIVALRNRSILDLAELAPAALLMQLADVTNLRVLNDLYGQLRHKIRHAITLLQEGQQ